MRLLATRDACARTPFPPFRAGQDLRDVSVQSYQARYAATHSRRTRLARASPRDRRSTKGGSEWPLAALGSTMRAHEFGGLAASPWCDDPMSKVGVRSNVDPFGGIAQLVERIHGMDEVRGSSPLASTSESGPSRMARACSFLDGLVRRSGVTGTQRKTDGWEGRRRRALWCQDWVRLGLSKERRPTRANLPEEGPCRAAEELGLLLRRELPDASDELAGAVLAEGEGVVAAERDALGAEELDDVAKCIRIVCE